MTYTPDKTTRFATIMLCLKVQCLYERYAIGAIKELSDRVIIRQTLEWPAHKDFYGEANHFDGIEDLEAWVHETYSLFENMGTDAQVEFYLVDRDDDGKPEYGTIYMDETGKRWVQFTYGGPRLYWTERPLSDYHLRA
jgi:hypothetical protein